MKSSNSLTWKLTLVLLSSICCGDGGFDVFSSSNVKSGSEKTRIKPDPFFNGTILTCDPAIKSGLNSDIRITCKMKQTGIYLNPENKVNWKLSDKNGRTVPTKKVKVVMVEDVMKFGSFIPNIDITTGSLTVDQITVKAVSALNNVTNLSVEIKILTQEDEIDEELNENISGDSNSIGDMIDSPDEEVEQSTCFIQMGREICE